MPATAVLHDNLMEELTEGPAPVRLAPAPPPPASAPDLGADFDPFVAPRARISIGDALPRSRVAVTGRVIDISEGAWVGMPVLEVTVDDGTGTLFLAFFGRSRIAGVEVGRYLTAGGTIGRRDGRSLMRNPQIWLSQRDPDF